MALLDDLVARADARSVISSSWRELFDLNEIQAVARKPDDDQRANKGSRPLGLMDLWVRAWVKYFGVPGKEHELEEGRARSYAVLDVMEQHLGAQPFFAGSLYSLADIALYAYIHAADEGGIALERYSAIGAWMEPSACSLGTSQSRQTDAGAISARGDDLAVAVSPGRAGRAIEPTILAATATATAPEERALDASIAPVKPAACRRNLATITVGFWRTLTSAPSHRERK